MGAKLTFSRVPLETWKVEDFLRCFDYTKRLFHVSSREFIGKSLLNVVLQYEIFSSSGKMV